jgi:hypothetical protein
MTRHELEDRREGVALGAGLVCAGVAAGVLFPMRYPAISSTGPKLQGSVGTRDVRPWSQILRSPSGGHHGVVVGRGDRAPEARGFRSGMRR